MSDEVKKVKTLTVNGTKYKFNGNVELLECGDISISADSNGIANLEPLFGTNNTTLTNTISATAVVGNKLDTDSTADAWTATSYAKGSFVSYQNKAYLANDVTIASDIPGVSSKWTVAKLPELFTSGNASMAAKADSVALATAWAANTAYALDEHVTYLSRTYKCTTAHTSGTVWDSTKWAEVKVYDNPDYEMLYDENTMHIATAAGSIVWADEYTKGAATTVTSTETTVTLSRNGVAYLDLTSATVATTVNLPTTELNGYTSDMLLMVKTPSSMASLTTPIKWQEDKVYTWMSSSSPLLFSTADAGKTFLYTFTAMPDGKFLVSRNELKGIPTITTTTATAGSTLVLAGTNLYNTAKVEYKLSTASSYTVLATSAWTKNSDTQLTLTLTTTASTTLNIRINGEATANITIS